MGQQEWGSRSWVRRLLLEVWIWAFMLISVAVTALLIVSAFLWLVYNTGPLRDTCGFVSTYSPEC